MKTFHECLFVALCDELEREVPKLPDAADLAQECEKLERRLIGVPNGKEAVARAFKRAKRARAMEIVNEATAYVEKLKAEGWQQEDFVAALQNLMVSKTGEGMLRVPKIVPLVESVDGFLVRYVFHEGNWHKVMPLSTPSHWFCEIAATNDTHIAVLIGRGELKRV